ncbi:hypothetical protein [Pseudovibrio sp. WM33]|uniref:hypothetical protein n=1 Tax=Pseudovibrio sp. WM33 TaxID=1735585 RepID=UPI0007AE8FDE|nr:hypothetical protein [Pseudovibrio sp. WM33]KZL27396.1 hypothetical protein PsWM33_00905 [Pseudovibrio sp. WM33]
MSSRTFNRSIFAIFCAVIIVIPFAAGYFNVTSLNATAMEWIQVISGLGALVIAVLTFRLVLAQLTKADAQLLKANVQIKLAHKQLDLANAQLDLARKDSAILTLQMRANAWAGIQIDLSIMDDATPVLQNSKFKTLVNLQRKPLQYFPDPGVEHKSHIIKADLMRGLDDIRIRFTENIVRTAGNLPDDADKLRSMVDVTLWELRDGLARNDPDSIDLYHAAVLDRMSRYTMELQQLKSQYTELLDTAKAKSD